MTSESKAFILRDGRTAVLKTPEPSDAADLLACLKQMLAETDFLLRYPDEMTMTEEGESAYIEKVRASETDIWLSCYVDGHIVGNCNLSLNRPFKTKHRASVAIGLLKDCWGLGIGTVMLGALTDAARKNGVERMELEYFEGNDRARTLYDRAGFVEIARVPDCFRTRDGKSYAEVIMHKAVAPETR